MQLPESSLRLQIRVVWPLVTLFQTNRAPVTIGYLQRGVFTAGGERASLLIRASIRCYPPATEQYADFADRRIYPRMLRIAADLPADYADFTNGFWGVQIDGFFRGLPGTLTSEKTSDSALSGGCGVDIWSSFLFCVSSFGATVRQVNEPACPILRYICIPW